MKAIRTKLWILKLITVITAIIAITLVDSNTICLLIFAFTLLIISIEEDDDGHYHI